MPVHIKVFAGKQTSPANMLKYPMSFLMPERPTFLAMNPVLVHSLFQKLNEHAGKTHFFGNEPGSRPSYFQKLNAHAKENRSNKCFHDSCDD
jgi:hypothetical protein